MRLAWCLVRSKHRHQRHYQQQQLTAWRPRREEAPRRQEAAEEAAAAAMMDASAAQQGTSARPCRPAAILVEGGKRFRPVGGGGAGLVRGGRGAEPVMGGTVFKLFFFFFLSGWAALF